MKTFKILTILFTLMLFTSCDSVVERFKTEANKVVDDNIQKFDSTISNEVDEKIDTIKKIQKIIN